MIIEPIISCGGQIELPKGFLKETFDEVRKADGICIVDEVSKQDVEEWVLIFGDFSCTM